MSLGCPVLSSNAGSLPEVGGDAAHYFDPACEGEIIAVIDSSLSHRGLDRNSMIEKALLNCERFTWEKTFVETVQGYKDVL